MLSDSAHGTEALEGNVARGGQIMKMENIEVSNAEELPKHKMLNRLFL